MIHCTLHGAALGNHPQAAISLEYSRTEAMIELNVSKLSQYNHCNPQKVYLSIYPKLFRNLQPCITVSLSH